MKCAWQEFLSMLPIWMRSEVDKRGRHSLQELRLRINMPPELVTKDGVIRLCRNVCADDLSFCINIASRYSPWTTETLSNCYITAPGGHRIGICGRAIIKNGIMNGIQKATSLCIRIARDFDGICADAATIAGSILIIGRPGSGKTTLLRDLIRCRSRLRNENIAVLDEREEIFPVYQGAFSFPVGLRVDVLSGCDKRTGIDKILRTMGPDTIAIDEITAEEDCQALLHAGWCGVNLIATAHADSLTALQLRPIYKPLIHSRLFENVIVLQPDKSWITERLNYDV